jgi:hypothetical protein
MKLTPRELELRAMREAAFQGEKPVMRPVLVTKVVENETKVAEPVTKRIGRPPVGKAAMTNSERVRRWRKSRETGE